MQKAYRFRLYPGKKQEEKMLETLDLCRQTYNILLGELNRQKVIDRSHIQGIIPDIKICDSKFKKLHSKTMQYECYKLFSNLQGLIRSKEKQRKVGRLRFKGRGGFKTFTYNQSGFKLITTGKRFQTLNLSKIGDIPIRCHRDIKGRIKQVTIKKEASGKWFASIVAEQRLSILKRQIKNVVSIDLGLTNIVYDSEGDKLENPKYFKKCERKLRSLQRKLSKKKKGSKNWLKTRIKIAKQYEKLVNTRNDFIHKLSTYYIHNYDAVGVEDMKITNLAHIIFLQSQY